MWQSLQPSGAGSGGGGVQEYDALSDLPSAPTDGDQAVVAGVLYEASDGSWLPQTSGPVRTEVSVAAWTNVPNLLAFVDLDFSSPSPMIPTSTSAWTVVP